MCVCIFWFCLGNINRYFKWRGQSWSHSRDVWGLHRACDALERKEESTVGI